MKNLKSSGPNFERLDYKHFVAIHQVMSEVEDKTSEQSEAYKIINEVVRTNDESLDTSVTPVRLSYPTLQVIADLMMECNLPDEIEKEALRKVLRIVDLMDRPRFVPPRREGREPVSA